MVFFTSVTEPTFGPNNPFLEAYTRAAEVGMNSCVQEQLGVTSGISHAVGATPLLLCVLGKLPARPRGIAITPLGLPKPGAKVAKFWRHWEKRSYQAHLHPPLRQGSLPLPHYPAPCSLSRLLQLRLP